MKRAANNLIILKIAIDSLFKGGVGTKFVTNHHMLSSNLIAAIFEIGDYYYSPYP